MQAKALHEIVPETQARVDCGELIVGSQGK